MNVMKTKNSEKRKIYLYIIASDLLAETISGLSTFGKSATEDTVEKLKNLSCIWDSDWTE